MSAGSDAERVRRIRRVLGDVYEPAGVEAFWQARHRALGGLSPADVWESGDQRLLDRLEDLVAGLAGGQVAT